METMRLGLKNIEIATRPAFHWVWYKQVNALHIVSLVRPIGQVNIPCPVKYL